MDRTAAIADYNGVLYGPDRGAEILKLLSSPIERAAAEFAEARKLSGDNRFSSLAQLKSSQYFGVPKVRALFETTYFAGLRLAGMPEAPPVAVDEASGSV
jgi:hypothetical protein